MNTFAGAVAPLAGRDAELNVLQKVVTRVLDNQAQVVALSGPAESASRGLLRSAWRRRAVAVS